MTLIGLYGDSRSGKDTVASILVKQLGFEQRNMANEIRNTLVAINPMLLATERVNSMPLEYAVYLFGWDVVKSEWPETVDWMINLGQHMRTISPRIWLDACLAIPYKRLVIADVRQPNEYNEIIQRGGVVWNIKRPGTTPRGMDRLLEDRVFETVLYNNGSISDLAESVVKCGAWRIHVSEADQKAAD